MEKKEIYLEKAQTWANDPYFDQKDRQEIADLLKNPEQNKVELKERFARDLEFGTGGLRSILGIGANRMNKYNVRRATQALSNIINKYFKHPTAVVSFDCRKFSPEFSKEVAQVFAANNIITYIFDELTPTPILSFAIRELRAQTGVMVTASHNPKIYNGYKAYWNDGAQVTPPYDKEIIDEYGKLTNWNEIKSVDFNEAQKNGLIKNVSQDVSNKYFQTIEKYCLNLSLIKNSGSKIHIIYTPLHGTGYKPAVKMAEHLGFNHFEVIKEQAVADSNFSTVKSPNPEDPIALEMAVNLMMKKNADIVFGTDPDGDRLGVVVNHHAQPVYLNGNQIAILMLEYILKSKKDQGTLPKKGLVIKSIVTSELQRKICDYFGVTLIDTLTGFKWMAQALKDEEEKKSGYTFLFASEESFGYMPFSEIRDKDGISSMALMSEIALSHKLQNKTVVDAFDDICNKYGFALEGLLSIDYLGLEGQEKIKRIMTYFRNSYLKIFEQNVTEVIDYLQLTKENFTHQTKTTFKMEKSDVLGFTFNNGDKLYLRPSGTEPKIKFYIMVQANEGTLKHKKIVAEDKITQMKNFIRNICESI
jgi:phosphoglucomutase